MINYFYGIVTAIGKLSLDRPEEIIFLIAMVLTLPAVFLLGVLFCGIHFRTRFKKLGAILWSIWTFILVGLVLFASSNLPDHGEERLMNDFWTNIVIYSVIPLYIIISALGFSFNRKKILCWLEIPLVMIISFLLFWSVTWAGFYHSYGWSSQEDLSEKIIAESDGADFELEMAMADPWFNDPQIVVFRVKGDSVYRRTSYKMCANLYADEDSSSVLVNSKNETFGPWLLLGKNEMDLVQKLKKRIMKYEPELSTEETLDGYWSRLSVKDFKAGKAYYAGFDNARGSDAYGAVSMEKLMDQLWPR